MISARAREDWEDLKAQGFNPTLDDFDRLNSLALRMTDGAETTAANFPRVGWAGEIPFYQPTYQAIAWYLTCASRLADDEDCNSAWFYALAHGRIAGAFDALNTPKEITEKVDRWLASLPCTRDEVRRACRFATSGFDDAVAGKTDAEKKLADEERDEKNLNAFYARLVECAAASGIPPKELERETPLTISVLYRKAKERTGEKLGIDKSALQRDYDLAYREIYNRLVAERDAKDHKGPEDSKDPNSTLTDTNQVAANG